MKRVLVLLLLAAGCSRRPDPPQLEGITPARGRGDRPTAVVISGTGLRPRLVTHFSDPRASVLDPRFAARLGREPLSDVALAADGSLSATVPPGLAVGAHDLVVVTPEGVELVLPRAFQVVSAEDADLLVERFRIEPLGPQRPGVPFVVTITALDGADATVDGFSGTATLSDETGTAVPRQAGAFVRGVWQGLVEVRTPHAADVLTVRDGDRVGTSNPFTVSAGPAHRLSFTTPSRAVIAGACSPEVRLEVLDDAGNPVTAAADLALSLRVAPPGGVRLYSDDTCSSELQNPQLVAGSSGRSFSFRATRAQGFALEASAAGVLGASQRHDVTPAPPAQWVFLGAQPTVNADACSPTLTLEVQDAFGNASPLLAPASVTLTPEMGSTLATFAADGCATGTTGLTLPMGATRGALEVRGTRAGVWSLTAESPGLSAATVRVRISPAGFPTQLVFVSPAQQLTVGACSAAVALQTRDSFGNAVAHPGSAMATLSASPATGFAFFEDAACTTPASTIVFGQGRDTALFHFRGTRAGAVTMTASAVDLQAGQQLAQLTPGPASRLEFTSAPQQLVAGGCSAPLELRATDADGNASSGMVSVQASASPQAQFFLDAACTQPGDMLTLAGSGALFVRSTSAGPLTVTASSAGLQSAVQVEDVAAGPPAQLAFSSAPQTLGAGNCSAAARLETRDAWGNATAASAAQVTLSAAPAGGFAFFADPGCGTPLGAFDLQTRDYFFFRRTQPGTVAVTASASGLMAAQQSELVTSGAATQLAFATAPRVTTAGTCSGQVELEARDSSGNATRVSADTSLSLTAPGLTFFSDASCGTALTGLMLTASSPTASAFYRGTTAGDVLLSASASGLSPASQTHTISPAAATRLAFTSAPFNVSAGACSPAMTFARVDDFGNASPGVMQTVVAPTASPAPGVSFFSDASCTTPASMLTVAAGTATGSLWVTGTTAGMVQVTLSSAGLTSASQTITFSAANAPTRLAFTTPPRTIVAGGCSAVLTVETRDTFGNTRAVTGDTQVDFAGASFFTDLTCTTASSSVTVPSGQSTVSVYARATTAGTTSLTASAAALNSAAQDLTITPDAPTQLVFVTAPQTLTAGACSQQATVEARDAWGNASPVLSTTSVALSATGGIGFFSDGGCSMASSAASLVAGQARASFSFRGTLAGAHALTARVAGWPDATQGATISSGAPARLVFTTPPRTVLAGACSAALTVEVRDAFDNVTAVTAGTTLTLSAAPAAGVTFATDAACAATTSQLTLSPGQSSGTFFARSTATGTITLSVTSPGLTAAQQALTVGAAPAARLVFTTPPRTTTAGLCSGGLTVELRDAFDNVASASSDLTLSLSASPALGFTFSAGAGCGTTVTSLTLAQGASSAAYFVRGTVSGSSTLTVASSGLTSATQSTVITPAAASSFAWATIASPRSLAVPFGVSVTARDAFNNVATSFVDTATLSLAPAGVVSCTSACTTATETAAFVAGVWSGTVTVSDAAAIGPGRTLTLTRGALNGTSNAFTVSGAAARTPPLARFAVRGPNVLGAVTLDAVGSSDYQTAASSLQVSWDATSAQSTPPPWTAWTTTKTTTVSPGMGLHRVRLAVRDADGDVATRLAFVRVFGLLESSCVVTTNADVDDGAVSCSAGFGADGQLSLAEAIRLANGAATPTEIAFTGPMTITGTGAYTLSRSVSLYGQAGVQLVGKTFNVVGSGVTARLYGLSLSGIPQVGQLQAPGSTFELHDVTLTDVAGFRSTGTSVLLEQASFSQCTGPCIEWDNPGAGTLVVQHSEFKASPTRPALKLTSCATSGVVLDVWGTTFTDLSMGVEASCDGTLQVRHTTFDAVNTALSFAGGNGHVVANSLFSTCALAASCGTATFATRAGHGLFNNGSDGCLAGDVGVSTVDPLYAFPASRDVRLSGSSPARDVASDLMLDLTLAQPGTFLGAAPDRGGRETY